MTTETRKLEKKKSVGGVSWKFDTWLTPDCFFLLFVFKASLARTVRKLFRCKSNQSVKLTKLGLRSFCLDFCIKIFGFGPIHFWLKTVFYLWHKKAYDKIWSTIHDFKILHMHTSSEILFLKEKSQGTDDFTSILHKQSFSSMAK